MTSQIAELTSSGSSRSWSGSEQKCHQPGACVPIVTAASAGRYFSQALVRRIESGASSSDLHHAGPVTPGGSNHVPLSGAALIELSNFTGRDWGLTGQGLSVARAPCARSFSPGHLVLASRPSEEMVRPLWAPGPSPMERHAGVWSVTLAFGPCAWAPGGVGEKVRWQSRFSGWRLPTATQVYRGSRSGRVPWAGSPHHTRVFTAIVSCHALQGRRAAGMDSSVQRVAWEVAVVEVVSWWLEQGWGRSACDRAAVRLTWSHSWLATGQTASGRRMDAMNSLCGQES